MWTIILADYLARALLLVLPSRWSKRIYSNCSEFSYAVLRTREIKQKPRMTLMEAVGATLLFDLALFGTDNFFINGFIRIFTNLQNRWDNPFDSEDVAKKEVYEFCDRLGISKDPWVWSSPPEKYTSLNDFFSRTYTKKNAPPIGDADIVSPACCTVEKYESDDGMKNLLIKGCDYRIEEVGLPEQDLDAYRNNPVLIGYLSPSDYHRVHAPITGKCVHLSLEGTEALSASVKFFGGKFNLLNNNKRLVVVLEAEGHDEKAPPTRVALVVVGGVGVNTIVYDSSMLGRTLQKGDEVSTFLAGGSAFAMFSNRPVAFREDFSSLCGKGMPVQVLLGESLGDFASADKS